jgi:protein involved in polysaccharide export with SLBB domain
LRDAIYQAGGETSEAWEETAQLFRAMPDNSTKVFSISLREALAGDPLNNIRIEPRDRILVHRQPERVSPRSVYVRGEVARPGRYPLADNMRVSDLMRSAGGLLRSANPTSGDLTHYAATSGTAAPKESVEAHAVNLAAALRGEEAEDFSLRDGDVLTVPQLSHAGGATGLANKKAIFIVRAKGSVISGGSGLISGGVLSSSIGRGDTIVVPEKAAFGGNTWKNVVAIAQIAQAAALAAAVAIP